MSRPKKNQRSLGFEHLEGKSSLTPLFGWGDSAPTADVARQQPGVSRRFLQFVATLEEISIERLAPDTADTQVVDHWMVSESPPREHD